MSNQLSYVFALVALVAIVVVVLGFNSGITGQFTQGTYRVISPICEDADDPKQDPFKFGVVTIQEKDGIKEHPDVCDGKMVIQFFCRSTVHFEGKGTVCEKGCLDGICLK